MSFNKEKLEKKFKEEYEKLNHNNNLPLVLLKGL